MTITSFPFFKGFYVLGYAIITASSFSNRLYEGTHGEAILLIDE